MSSLNVDVRTCLHLSEKEKKAIKARRIKFNDHSEVEVLKEELKRYKDLYEDIKIKYSTLEAENVYKNCKLEILFKDNELLKHSNLLKSKLEGENYKLLSELSNLRLRNTDLENNISSLKLSNERLLALLKSSGGYKSIRSDPW